MADDFVITRSFAAPRPEVWDAWTDPDRLARWSGPRGCDFRVVSGHVAPGATVHTCMEMPNGSHMWGRYDYREVEPPRRLVWDHAFADAQGNRARAPFSDSWPMVLLSTVDFENEGQGTRVTITWRPEGATEAEERTFRDHFTSMRNGWTGSLDQLDAHLAEGRD